MRTPLVLHRVRARLRGSAGSPGQAAPGLDERVRAVADKGLRRVLQLAAPGLAASPEPLVGALTAGGAAPKRLEAALAQVVPAARLVRVDGSLDAGDLHVELAARGPFDVLLDLMADQPEAQRARRAQAVLMHLRSGGVLVVRQARRGEADRGRRAKRTKSDAAPEGFADVIADAFDAALAEPPKNPAANDYRAGWGRALGLVEHRGGDLALVNRLPARAKLREGQVAAYLALRGETAGRVLVERPATVVDNPAPIRASPGEDAPVYSTHFEAPPMQLREYRDVACHTGQVVTQGNVLLPETYRHLARPRLGNRWVDGVADGFGRVRQKGKPTVLEGAYFHLDSEFRGHFGHAMTEQLSRLWAWREAKAHEPDLKALVLVNKGRDKIYGWEKRLYAAAGVDPDDLVLAEGTVRVERLLAATPMFSQPQYVHAGISELYRQVGDDLVAEAPDKDYPELFFCSRRHQKRSCRNTPEVEEFFAERGFEIVFPEEYPLGEQVRMFRSARVVAGFGGSAMFTAAFVPEPTTMVLVSSENYRAQNEALIAAVQGHQLNVAWCRPDKPRSEGYSGKAALQSTFAFDPDREGRFLAQVLEEGLAPTSGT